MFVPSNTLQEELASEPLGPLHLVVVWEDDDTTSLYRNGLLYAR